MNACCASEELFSVDENKTSSSGRRSHVILMSPLGLQDSLTSYNAFNQSSCLDER